MRTETVERAAGWAAGIVTGASFIILFVATSAPVIETVQKFVS